VGVRCVSRFQPYGLRGGSAFEAPTPLDGCAPGPAKQKQHYRLTLINTFHYINNTIGVHRALIITSHLWTSAQPAPRGLCFRTAQPVARAKLRLMTRQRFAELLASRLLAREGLAAIWDLHLVAAGAYRNGRLETAEALVILADAAERAWLRGNDG
jgi:hypothetical protein